VKTDVTDTGSAKKDKVKEEKTEGTKTDGEGESLEVLVDDTQYDLDADLKEGGEAKSADSDKPSDATEGEAGKTSDDATTKTADGDSKEDEKKPDDKRLVGFV